MLNSSHHKQVYCGWLKKNQPNDFGSDLKLQKFLFFYESLAETEDGNGQFSSLKGYKKGPVFSDVYGDYTYERSEFNNNVEKLYNTTPDIINDDFAKLAGFLVEIMSEDELSLLTHEFNIWKAKEYKIRENERQVRLHKEDFNQEDKNLMITFKEMYSIEYIDSVEVIKVFGKSFIISKEDMLKITEDQRETLMMIASQQELLNPVYISISEDGVILVD
ncbi:hypothetical protein [Cohnella sp. WQ 127256]|uniref:hypothetical protein n=1 Tax=Cohnella sp. WQ 127256 TaxID=2938790 RepID=UPI0021199183|nr:hypothetical protein [Cohnella sp. WQ 127256]